MRLTDGRMVKRALHQIYENRSEGDMLMDLPHHDDRSHIQKMAADKDYWKSRYRTVKEGPRGKWQRMSKLMRER